MFPNVHEGPACSMTVRGKNIALLQESLQVGYVLLKMSEMLPVQSLQYLELSIAPCNNSLGTQWELGIQSCLSSDDSG